MTTSNLIVFKKQTDAITTNRGFYYQYLITLKLWLVNYLTKENIEIYCETEDDIFQINKSMKKVSFTQVKCYTEGFSIKSNEILKSLLNFFFLHLKYGETYNGEYIFETNAGTKLNAGKFLKNWADNQKNAEYIKKNCVNEVRLNLLRHINKEISEKSKRISDPKVIAYFSKIKSEFQDEINSDSFSDFLTKIRWQFLQKEPKIAINELTNEINELINLLQHESIPSNLIFGRLLSEILIRSSEKELDDRLIHSELLADILNESIDIIKAKLLTDVAMLMKTNFQILNDLDIIKNVTAKSFEILKDYFNNDLPFDEFVRRYTENALEKLTRVDFFALNTPQGVKKSQKIRLQDIYVKPNFFFKKQKSNHQNIDLEIPDRSSDKLVKYSDLFQSKKNIVILGGPGAGKSILTKSIICGILNKDESEFVNEDIFYYLPFRIELRKYLASKKENRDNISKYLIRILEDEYYIPKLTVKQIEEILENFPTLFIFDGLDEIFDTTNKNEIVEDIEIFTKTYKKMKSIVTSRIYGYDEAKLGDSFLEIYFYPFNDIQIKEYLSKWYNLHLSGEENDQLRNEEINLFLSQKDQIDKELLTNPLLLSLIVILFSNNLKIPNSKLAIYENCTNTLVDKWDSSKQLKIEISPELLKFKETIFADLAYWQYIQTSIRIETKENNLLTHKDAIETVRKTIMDKLKLVEEYSIAHKWAEAFLTYAQKRSLYFDNEFTHKTFREYYTAFWIYTNLDRKHKTEERDELISTYISNPFWHIVLELLINMIDEKQPDNEIIDELIKTQIRKNEWSYIFILDILPKIKHISKSLIIETVKSAILCAISNFNRLKTQDNSLSERITEGMSSLISDVTYFNLVDKAIIDLFPTIKDDEKILENYIVFIKELEILPFRRSLDQPFSFKLPSESNTLIDKNEYLFFLIYLKNSAIKFEHFVRFINLFGSKSIFKNFTMYFLRHAEWAELSVRYLLWQFENIESIEPNIETLKGLNVKIEDFFHNKFTYYRSGLDYERIINHLPHIVSNEIKAFVLYFLSSRIDDDDILTKEGKKFTLGILKTITEGNPDQEILEYLIFSKDNLENKLKKIEEETGYKIELK